MPRVDRFTGCTVMSMAEFLDSEGKRLGKTGGEVLADIFKDMDEDSVRIAEHQRDPNVALAILQAAAKFDREDYENWCNYIEVLRQNPDDEWKVEEIRRFEKQNLTKPPYPIAVMEVLDSYHFQNFGGNKTRLRALVRCDDGLARTVLYNNQYFNGSMDEPPDDDYTLEWEP